MTFATIAEPRVRPTGALRSTQRAELRKQRSLAAALPFMGPALIASVAYMDPGNIATNIQGGASAGYKLLWVVLAANLVAMLFQALSAKLGIVTGSNLAELSRVHFSKRVVYAMWAAAEIGAMATDLAEFLGASIALKLLLHLSLLAATLVTGTVTYGALELERRGTRLIETLIAALVGVIGLSYLAETVLARPDWSEIAYHSVVPWLGGSDSVLLAAGIVGATVMPQCALSAWQPRSGAAHAGSGRPDQVSDPPFQSRCRRRARAGRPYQPGDDVHGGRRVSRRRP
jgi:manganese transport protein